MDLKYRKDGQLQIVVQSLIRTVNVQIWRKKRKELNSKEPQNSIGLFSVGPFEEGKITN